MSTTLIASSSPSETPSTVFGNSWTGSASGQGTSPYVATIALSVVFSLAAAFALGVVMLISWSAWRRRRRAFSGTDEELEREREVDLVEHWVEWRRRLRGEDSREIEKLGKEPELTEVVIGEEWYDEEGGIVPLSLTTQKLDEGNQTIATVSYLILLPTPPESRPTSEHDASENGSLSSEEGTSTVRSWSSEEGCLPEMELGYETVLVVDGDRETPKEGEGKWWKEDVEK